MKLSYEFDYEVQDPQTTQSELEVSINAFKAEEGLSCLQIHTKRTSKSKKLIEGFLTWGEGEITQTQLDAIAAILASQYGLVGYSPPLPEPLFIYDLENIELATLELPTPGETYQGMYLVARQNPDSTRPNLRLGRLLSFPDTNTYTDENINDVGYAYTLLVIQNMIAGAPSLTVPVNDITITYDGSQTLTLSNLNPIVIEENSATGNYIYYIDTNGYLYLQRTPITEGWGNTFEEAIANGRI